ncbi:MAG: cysteine desulfurase family protein [Clostridia bacterium]|nr:cysteine desulfurase family protein [Clostridia bacterium]
MIAYLDNSATTRPGEGVIEAMDECMRGGYFNPSSLYAEALKADKSLDRCREAIKNAIHVSSGSVIFTSGGTEANNLAIIGSTGAMYGKKRILLSAVEHPSVLAAGEYLKGQGCEVIVYPVDRAGQPVWDVLEGFLDGDVGLVSCMQVNNEVGSIADIARLCALVRKSSPEALIHVDGVQGFLREDFDANMVDMYTLSGHKLNGPKGIGALWTRAGVRLKPIIHGGGQENNLRSGTENTPGIAGLCAAIADMKSDGIRAMKDRLIEKLLKAVPEMVINGPDPASAARHILNVSFPGVRGEVMLHALEGLGVYVSTGSACSSKKRKISPVLLALGLDPNMAQCAVRFSLCQYTTAGEIDYAADCVASQYELLKRFHRR